MIDVSIEPDQLPTGRERELEVRFTNTGIGTCTDIVFKLGLPQEVLLLRGLKRMEIPELQPGQTSVHHITVRPRATGQYTVTSGNFSYRDEYGMPVRVPGFRAGLSVLSGLPDEPPAGPDLVLAVLSGPLTAGEWAVLRLQVRNTTRSALRRISLSISGPIRMATPAATAVPDLAPGGRAEVSFIASPQETGSHVPVRIQLDYADGTGRGLMQASIIPLTVSSQAAGRGPGPRPTAARPDTILFLAASPTDLQQLRPDKEMREIHEMLQLGKHRERFRLESAVAVRLKDIGQALADYDPRIVHFAGHGQPDGSIYVEDELGHSTPVAPAGLAELFGLHARTMDCAIVNACHTLLLARAIAQHIDYVVAMRCAIGDGAAILFSTGFYQGLAAGAAVSEAFTRGRAFLMSQAVGQPEHDTPVLLGRGGQELA